MRLPWWYDTIERSDAPEMSKRSHSLISNWPVFILTAVIILFQISNGEIYTLAGGVITFVFVLGMVLVGRWLLCHMLGIYRLCERIEVMLEHRVSLLEDELIRVKAVLHEVYQLLPAEEQARLREAWLRAENRNNIF